VKLTGTSGLGYAVVGVVFVDRRVGGVRRIRRCLRRGLALRRLTSWVAAREVALSR
jgi:hypothetical protein